MTERQKQWAKAARKAAAEGNAFAAALFTMLAQPNAKEKASAGS